MLFVCSAELCRFQLTGKVFTNKTLNESHQKPVKHHSIAVSQVFIVQVPVQFKHITIMKTHLLLYVSYLMYFISSAQDVITDIDLNGINLSDADKVGLDLNLNGLTPSDTYAATIKKAKCSSIFDPDEPEGCGEISCKYIRFPRRNCKAWCTIACANPERYPDSAVRDVGRDGDSDGDYGEDGVGLGGIGGVSGRQGYSPMINGHTNSTRIIQIPTIYGSIFIVLCLSMALSIICNIYYSCKQMQRKDKCKYAKVDYMTDTDKEQV